MLRQAVGVGFACAVLLHTAQPRAQQLAPSQPAAPAAAPRAPRNVPYVGAITLAVDASNVVQGIFNVHETIPVTRGAQLTLLYPEWRPGNHAPTGQSRLARIAGLVISADGKPLAWTRDPINMLAYHVPMPSGVTVIDVDFQYLAPPATRYGPPETTPNLLTLDWDAVTLYPDGFYARRITVNARVKLPAGWQLATALEHGAPVDDETVFDPTTLETLVDSPLYAGAYAKRIDLDPGANVPVHLDLFADHPEQLAVTPDELNAHRDLVQQSYRLFGAHHYDHYDFLVSLSDTLPLKGTEHHRSSFDGLSTNYLTEWDKSAILHALLAHEFAHSWNGKFRRPADLWTPNYNVPMRDSLLWMYEGQTQYWGVVLAARSKLFTQQQVLELLAMVAAQYGAEPGRNWRSLADTTNQPIIQYQEPLAWPSWQRAEDYYNVGLLLWLDADTLIREQSHGQRSLDDFARAFFGIDAGDYGEVTYTRDDIIAGLTRVLPYDWAAFLHQRIDLANVAAPAAGISRGGYDLVFNDTQSAMEISADEVRKSTSFTYSLGLSVDKDGEIKQVLWNGPAFQAGLAPGSRLIAVDEVAFSVERLKAAIQAAQHTAAPMSLIVRDGDRIHAITLDYHGGLRYPHLERNPARPDLLQTSFAPRG